MAHRGYHSSYSSPSVSPEIMPRPYDPFDPPLDPIEMHSFTQRSADAQSPGSSPDPSQRIHMSDLRSPSRTRGSSRQGDYEPIQPAGSAPRKSVGGASIRTVGSTLTPYKTMDAATQALVNRRAGEVAQWHVHWQTPAIILVLFVAGVIGAVGHHLFYAHLDGRPAEDQLKMIRYGTALAFWTKATLVGTVVLSYRQRIWHTFRTRAMTINAIDGLFSATDDPSQFRNWEMIRNAKLATIMAICTWLIPIASVLSPASLTSDIRTSKNETHCPSVATLNFTKEATFNFRDDTNFPGSSLIYYNTTDTKGQTPGWFDYYDQPSKNARRLTTTAVYLQSPSQDKGAQAQSCDQGWNCTYTVTFEAPGYKCVEVANSTNENTAEIVSQGAPFNISSLAPKDQYIYLANVDNGNYADPQIDTNSDGTPKQQPPYPDTLGAFQSEPILWIGYAINTTKPYDSSSPYASQWRAIHEPKIFRCEAYHTEYTYEFGYVDGIQNTTLKNRTFITPVVDTTLSVNPNNASDFTASPTSNFVRPTDVATYKVTAAYYAMGALLRDFLRGEISTQGTYPVTKSDISETRLIDSKTAYPVSDLMDQVQSVFEDMIITLLSEPHLNVIDKASVPCNKTRTVNVFVYHAEGLWIGYAIVVSIAFIFMLVGAYSIWENGVASDTQFSRIMVTTRNPTIDRLSVGACLGGNPFPKELRRTKLRFGVLLEDHGREWAQDGTFMNMKVEHCTFGTEGETKDIVKNGLYAGLKKYRRDVDEELGNATEKMGLLSPIEEEEESDEKR